MHSWHDATKRRRSATRFSADGAELLQAGRRPLSGNALAGLFGELWLLRRMVATDPSRRIDHWSGPTGAVHDFHRSGIALEVKTTARREGRFAEIHGLQQLETEIGTDLFLAFVRIETHDDGTCVAALIRELEGFGVDAALLGQLLTQVGWDPEAGQDETFRVDEFLLFKVDDRFPRIVPASFAAGAPSAGVLRIRYEVDLTGAVPCPLASAEADSILMMMAMAP